MVGSTEVVRRDGAANEGGAMGTQTEEVFAELPAELCVQHRRLVARREDV
jgi:hypothetical protein